MNRFCKIRHLLMLGLTLGMTAPSFAQFPVYTGGTNHVIHSDQTAPDAELLIGEAGSASNILSITSNAVVRVYNINISDSKNNELNLLDNSRLYAGTTTFTTTNGASLIIGDANGGSDDALLMGNGSKVTAEYLYMGAASNNTYSMELNGSNTVLLINKDVSIGAAGDDNKVNINDGATFKTLGNLEIGSTIASNNAINVNSGGTLWVNSLSNITVNTSDTAKNDLIIKNKGTLEIGGDMRTANLQSSGVTLNTGAKVAVNGTLTAQGNSIGNIAGKGLNIVLNTSTSKWTTASGNAYVGKSDKSNSLTLTNQATVAHSTLYIGYTADADSNKVFVDGGSQLIARSALNIGWDGGSNELTVTNATVLANALVIGKNDGADSNKMYVQDGASITVTNNLVLGDGGANGRYTQTGGTNTVLGAFIIGKTEDASGKTGSVNQNTVNTTGNLAMIGTNSTLNIGELVVGQKGAGSIMTIRDGGLVNVAGDVVIGSETNDNYIYLQRDSNTLFNVAGNLTIGQNEGNNRFAIYGGTANIAGNTYLGSSTNTYDQKNYIHLETTNATLHVAGTLYIGELNSSNTMDIAKGATATVQDLVVGANGTSNNVVSIYGDKSMLSISNDLVIGTSSGSNNTLTASDGGILQVHGDILFGTVSGTNLNNQLVIDDGGVLQHDKDWDATTVNTNMVFKKGSFLELGGQYHGTNAVEKGFSIALNNSLSTNTAVWSVLSKDLYIGKSTSDNTLSVRNGALAETDQQLIIGSGEATKNNHLIVTGALAQVSIGTDLILGEKGDSNTLEIYNGGTASVSNNLIVANKVESIGNKITLTGETNALATLEIGNDLLLGNRGDNNELNILSNSLVNVGNDLIIGVTTNATGNKLSMTGSNATLNVMANLVVGDAGKGSFTLSSNVVANVYSNLQVGAASAGNTLRITGDNAVLNVYGDFLIGATTNATGNTVTIGGGSNSVLSVSNNLYVGKNSTGNSFNIQDDASVEVLQAVYVGTSNKNNSLTITGTNSLLTAANLFIGSTETNLNSLVSLSDLASIHILNDLNLNSGTLDIDVGDVIVDGNYTQEANGILSITISTNFVGTNLIVGGIANFKEDSTILVKRDSTIPNHINAANEETNDVVRTIVSAGDLQVDGEDATTSLLQQKIIISPNSFVEFALTVTNDTIMLDNFTERSFRDAGSLTGMLGDVADELDALAAASNAQAIAMIDLLQNGYSATEINTIMDAYYGEKASASPMHNVVNWAIGNFVTELNVRGDSTRAKVLAKQNAPEGAAGPHMQGQELQAWLKGYGTSGDKKSSGGYGAYDSSASGFILGVDLSVASNVLFGVAGGTGSADASGVNGKNSNADITYLGAYTSVGTKEWFFDGSLSYGNSSIHNKLGDTFNTTSDYDANNIAIFFGAGKEMIGDYLIITPKVSLLANIYNQDGYTESATNAVGRTVDGFNTWYLQSSIGFDVALYAGVGENFTIKPEVRLHWLHEFNADEESVRYQVNGSDFNMILQSPDSDIIKLGAGLSAEISEYTEISLDGDLRFGDNYSDYTIGGSVRYQF